MSQTKPQAQGAAPAGARSDWELFWRIIAGLMLLIIAWIAWVLYQIAPRSVATPLAYESQIKRISTQNSAAAGTMAPPLPTAAASAAQATAPVPAAEVSASAPAAQAGAAAVAVPAAPPEAAAAALAMDQAQAGARSGAHQSSADIQAAALEQQEERRKREEQASRERLKLSTEIATPPVERETIPKKE